MFKLNKQCGIVTAGWLTTFVVAGALLVHPASMRAGWKWVRVEPG